MKMHRWQGNVHTVHSLNVKLRMIWYVKQLQVEKINPEKMQKKKPIKTMKWSTFFNIFASTFSKITSSTDMMTHFQCIQLCWVHQIYAADIKIRFRLPIDTARKKIHSISSTIRRVPPHVCNEMMCLWQCYYAITFSNIYLCIRIGANTVTNKNEHLYATCHEINHLNHHEHARVIL